MTKRLTVSKVLKAIGSDHLKLHHGNGYWYFTFDDGKRYNSRSVYAFHLTDETKRDLGLAYWVTEGRDFLKAMDR